DRRERLVVELRADVDAGREARDAGLFVAARRVAVDGALGRFDRLPRVEIVEAREGRQVIAERGGDQLLRRFFLREEGQQVLRRRLVAREAPDAIELRQLADEAAFWSARHGVRPAIFRNLRVVALGDRPGGGRVHDAGALARDEPAVVAGVVPRVDVGWICRHQLLQIFER